VRRRRREPDDVDDGRELELDRRAVVWPAPADDPDVEPVEPWAGDRDERREWPWREPWR